MQTSEKIELITTALIEAQKEIEPAIKDSVNPHFKSKFADLASNLSVSKGPLNKHGVLLTQSTDVNQNGFMLITRLTHTSGQWIQSTYPIRPVKDDPQGLGSAISYAKRYSLAALIGIETADDDAEQAMGRHPHNTPIQNLAPAPLKEQTQTRPSPTLAPVAIPAEVSKSSWVQAVNKKSEEASQPNHDPIGDYTPTFGKYKGMKIRDVLIHDLNGYVQYIQKSAAESNKPISRNAAEFISEVNKFLNTRAPVPKNTEPTQAEIEQAFMAEQIPY